MAVYTTQLRSICESLAGYTEEQGFNKIEEIIAAARTSIFNFPYPIFDNAYKPDLETKILRHFYTREIGAETYGQWKLFLSQKLNEIMPFYNQLYSSELLLAGIDPFEDVNYTRTLEHSGQDVDEEGGLTQNTGSVNNSGTDRTVQSFPNYQSTTTPNLKTTTRKSDTPQGGINGIESNTYLSEADIVDQTGSSTTAVSGTVETALTHGLYVITSDNTQHGKSLTKNYDSMLEEHFTGKMGTADYASILKKLRETFLNVDQMILEDLNVCFMNIF